MFTVNMAGGGNVPADTSLLLMPTVSKIQRGPLTEDVWMFRDEVANMVWGVAKTVPLASGDSKPGLETARQTLAFYQAQLARPGPPAPPPPAAAGASVRYQVMTTVPENWIPFVPVHVDGDNRETQRTRAADGRVYTWLRVRRQTGRGEVSSGLAFDQIVSGPPSG